MATALPLEWVKKTINDQKHLYIFDYRVDSLPDCSALQAAQNNIASIVTRFPPPYVLYLSGGSDSQAMLYAWHLSGIPFSTYSAVYNENLNFHDLEAMRQFSYIHNIKINYVEFDLFKFLQTEHDHFARTYYSGSPQFTSFMKMVDGQKEGTAIMSGNPLLPTKVVGSYIEYGNNLQLNAISLYHYARIANKNFVPYFLLESPETTYGFTLNDYTRYFMEDTTQYMIAYKMKIALYQSHGFPVLQQVKTTNGFEKVKEWFDAHYDINTIPNLNKLKIYKQKSMRVFDLLYRTSYEQRIANHKYIVRSGVKGVKNV
jgi:hypothetical protein